MSEQYGLIYFIGPKNGPVKIGFTANRNVSVRLKQLQTGAADRYEILGSFEAYFEIEKSLHVLLQVHRTRSDGEWFERDAALSILNCWQSGCRSDEYPLPAHSSGFLDRITAALDEIYMVDKDSFELLICRSLIHDVINNLRDTFPDNALPLYAWLMTQLMRDDPVGDLANEVRFYDSFPKVAHLSRYLEFVVDRSMSPAVIRTVLESWIECYHNIQRLRFRPEEVMHWPRR